MATIVINNIDSATFQMIVGVIDVVKTKTYHAFESTGEYIRTEQVGTEHSDLFNPIHFSEIEIDGVIYGSANETVSALNDVVFAVGETNSSTNITSNFIRAGRLYSTSDSAQVFTFDQPFLSSDGTQDSDIIVQINREIEGQKIPIGATSPTLTGFTLNRDDSIDGSGTTEPFTYIAVNTKVLPSSPPSSGDVVLDIQNYYNFSQTQWSTTLPSDIIVNDVDSLTLTSVLTDANKLTSGTTEYDEYNINNDGLIIIPYTGRPYENLRIKHDIRVDFNIDSGGAQDYRIELRRFDDTVIGSPSIVSRKKDETGIQKILMTYVSSATDSFVTGGFKIVFVNESGSDTAILGDVGLLIFNTFQKPVKFI